MTTPRQLADETDHAAGTQQRLATLRGGIDALPRSRAATAGGRDSRLWKVGAVAAPAGLVLIVLGWYGTSRTIYPFEQTPYLVSGGLLGLALVFLGGFTYFSYWMTVLVRENRDLVAQATAAAHEQREHNERLEALLERALAELPAAGRPVLLRSEAATRPASSKAAPRRAPRIAKGQDSR